MNRNTTTTKAASAAQDAETANRTAWQKAYDRHWNRLYRAMTFTNQDRICAAPRGEESAQLGFAATEAANAEIDAPQPAPATAAHTAEPWAAIEGDTFNPERPWGVSKYLSLEACREIDGDDAKPNSRTEVIAEVCGGVFGQAEQDAKRIVACVNACQGYATKHLEGIIESGESLRIRETNTEKRHETELERLHGDVAKLRAALDHLVKAYTYTRGDAGHNDEAAIEAAAALAATTEGR